MQRRTRSASLLSLAVVIAACGAPASSPQGGSAAASVVPATQVAVAAPPTPSALSAAASPTPAQPRSAVPAAVIATGLRENPNISGFAVSLAVIDQSVWVGSPAGLVRVDPTTGAATIVDSSPGALVAGEGNHLWRSGFYPNRVMKYDTRTSKRLLSLDIPGPLGVLVTRDAVYVVQHNEGLILKLDPTTGRAIASTRIAAPGSAGPGYIAMAAGSLWVVVPREKTIVKLAPKTLRVLAKLTLDVHPGEELSYAAGALWAQAVAFEGEPAPAPGTLLRIDPATGGVTTSTVPDDHGPVSELEGEPWLAAGDRLVQLDRVTGQPVRSINLAMDGYLASLLLEAFGGVWVAAQSDPRVLRLAPRDLRPVVG